MFSLNLGGVFVKVIWAILDLGTALLGLMLWLETGAMRVSAAIVGQPNTAVSMLIKPIL